MSGWIGVDLDGTLAHYEGWGDGSIGAPIPVMVERVKAWIADGKEVRIFTARVWKPTIPPKWPAGGSDPDDSDGRGDLVKMAWEADEQHRLIDEWCAKHIGQALPVTCQKDFGMIELWDDRCVQVEMNTGLPVRGQHP